MYDDDTDTGLDDATLQLRAILPNPEQTTGNDGVSSSLGSPCWPFPAVPARPLYRLVERSRGEPPPVGYSVLSDVVRSIVNTRERLARWRSGQNGLLCARARRLQMQREEWEA